MTILDIIILVILAVGFILGFKDGLLRKLIGLIGFILGVYLAIHFASAAGRLIDKLFGIEYYLAEILGGLLIFFLIISIAAIIKRVVHPFDKINNVVNQLLGGFVGTIQILFFVSAVFFLLNIFGVPDKKARKDSLLYNRVYNVIPDTIEYISNYTPQTKKVIKDYINDKDSL